MLTSHELLGFMSPALANDILNFAYESDKPTYKAAPVAIAQIPLAPDLPVVKVIL
jgi:hypothetical protein